jgi:hypothetical protein
MDQNRIQFSAKFESPFFGPITQAAVSRVRDVLICATDPSAVDFTEEEMREQPPIAWPRLLREEGESPPVDLGRGVRIDRLPQEEVELVMNACTPRGHYFSPIRAVGQRCSLIRDLDLAEYEEHPLWWDGVIYDALSLSRLVRDNGYSTEFAARITDYEDGLQTVLYTLAAESKHVYRLRRDREWLDPSEGAELRDLLFATGQEAQEATGTQQGPQTAEQWAVFGEIARVQDLLRRAVRRCVEDEEFRAVFADDDAIRSRWPT